jgi:starch synthase
VQGKRPYLKADIVFADLINTVSRRASQQIQTAEFSCGPEGILRYRGQDVYGILNGNR